MVVSKNAGSFKRAPLGVRKGSYPFKKWNMDFDNLQVYNSV